MDQCWIYNLSQQIMNEGFVDTNIGKVVKKESSCMFCKSIN